MCSDECKRARSNDAAVRYYHLARYGRTEFRNDPLLNSKDRFAAARKHGYRSGLEVSNARRLEELGTDFGYESCKLPFVQPVKHRTYCPDILLPNGIVVELKGQFDTDARMKMKMVKEQHPDIDIRFVFSSSRSRLSKGSKTTYGMWSTQHGFPYADKVIPKEWLEEPVNEKSQQALAAAAIPTKKPPTTA